MSHARGPRVSVGVPSGVRASVGYDVPTFPPESYGIGIGIGDGDGYGYGNGDGIGFGYGDGCGTDYGDGYGDGNSHGDGDGNGFGDGDGDGIVSREPRDEWVQQTVELWMVIIEENVR